MLHSLLSMQTQILGLLLRSVLPTLSELEKENLFLRYQLMVLKRKTKKPHFTPADRTFLSILTRSMKS